MTTGVRLLLDFNTWIATINITRTALAAAVLCSLGPLSIPLPISPVPISLGVLGVFFAVYVNGWLWGTVSCLLYLFIGFVGVPVFSGFSAGAGKLLGPTGGYMTGYIFIALIAGFFIERFEKKIPRFETVKKELKSDEAFKLICGKED